ncbi:MAG: aldo/keto reductase [Candidatus Poribacteria bacterium]|nr:aldo/keto reductase [Candidatus Poribacteria bacterium]
MEYLAYGKTGLEISRLCFGAGRIKDTCDTVEAGSKLMLKALDEGVTFWDTAEGYGTQPHLGEAVRQIFRDEVVIQTKTGAKDYEGAKASITRSLQELQTDYLDVLLLHGISTPEDLVSREGALDAFREAKAAGKIRVIGCSTHIHTGTVMDAVIDHPEIEVILATANKEGRMLEGGPLDKHLAYIQRAYNIGKGISIMKVVVAGDVPEADIPEWIEWGFNLETAHAINLGMTDYSHITLDVGLARASARRRLIQRKAA